MRGLLVVAVIVTAVAALVTIAEGADPEDARPARFPRPTRSDLGWFAVCLLWAPLAGRAVLAVAEVASRHSPLRDTVAPSPPRTPHGGRRFASARSTGSWPTPSR